MNYVLNAEAGHINFSPVGFRKAAQDFMEAYESSNLRISQSYRISCVAAQ
jgi:hypothetical protein